jgi:hypothetical protein
MILLAVGTMMLYGCDIKEYFFNPNNIMATPSPSESGIQWGENKPIVTANILSVAIECFPVKTYEGGGLFGGRAKNKYEIAATARVSCNIIDKNSYDKSARYPGFESHIIFEALSISGVVLGQALGQYRVVEGAGITTVSVKILDMSFEEVNKVKRVQARWKYGK